MDLSDTLTYTVIWRMATHWWSSGTPGLAVWWCFVSFSLWCRLLTTTKWGYSFKLCYLMCKLCFNLFCFFPARLHAVKICTSLYRVILTAAYILFFQSSNCSHTDKHDSRNELCLESFTHVWGFIVLQYIQMSSCSTNLKLQLYCPYSVAWHRIAFMQLHRTTELH